MQFCFSFFLHLLSLPLLQAKEAVAALMASRGLGPDKQQAGSSKIFLRAGVLATFEAARLQSACYRYSV